jgi:hypothetical protein
VVDARLHQNRTGTTRHERSRRFGNGQHGVRNQRVPVDVVRESVGVRVREVAERVHHAHHLMFRVVAMEHPLAGVVREELNGRRYFRLGPSGQ